MQQQNKVAVGLGFETHEMTVTSTGRIFSPEFRNKFYDKEEEFRSKIILPINALTEDFWAIKFVDFRDPTAEKYLVDISIEDRDLLPKIVEIIVAAFPEKEFSFYILGGDSFYSTKNFFH